jgi:hypothetical protein
MYDVTPSSCDGNVRIAWEWVRVKNECGLRGNGWEDERRSWRNEKVLMDEMGISKRETRR